MVARAAIPKFMGAVAMKKYMAEDYGQLRAFLVELDLAKK